jgi:hypothetical protein
VGIGVSSPDREDRNKYDKAADEACGVNIPVAENAGDELVRREQHIIEGNHLAGDEFELATSVGKERLRDT